MTKKSPWVVPDPKYKYIGKAVPRTDAYEKVTGQALYPGDLTRPGMLYMKILFAGRPHAKLIHIDTGRALDTPGVVAILTADDVPVNEYGLALNDQPVLCDDVVRFEGDQIAVVVAKTEQAAFQARDLIKVTYKDLNVVSDPRQAMEPDCVQIHSNHVNNILQHFPIRKGDIDKGFEQAKAIVSGTYTLPMQEHAFLEPEAGLAYLDGDQVVIETAGQWAHHDQRQIAHALGIQPELVRVIYRSIGGAFGGREDLSVQIVLALAALKTGQPVKIIWNREESIRGHCKRHQMFINARWGANQEGKLTAAEVEVIADAGAYAYTSTMVLGQVALTCTGVYEIPNVSVDAYMVYTNNIPGGAFRGFGSPQGTFAAELQMEKLADELGLDPITIRGENLLTHSSLLSVGTPLPSDLHLHRLLNECAKSGGWSKKGKRWIKPKLQRPSSSSKRRGIGLAIGFKNIGFSYGYPDKSTISIELHGGAEMEKAIIYYAGAECGQGTLTAIHQIAAESLRLPLERIQMITTDTNLTPESGSASASRLTLMAGNAVAGAAREVLKEWENEERPARGNYTYHAPPTKNFEKPSGKSVPNFAYGTVAQVVEIEIDLETGELLIQRVITVLDVGKAINPKIIEGQVEGAIAQGIGYAVLENYYTVEGITLTPTLSTYLLPTAMDMPTKVETLLLEQPESIGHWGARGIGESPLIGIGPALVSAIKQATGVWIDQLPLTPTNVLAVLNSENNHIIHNS